MEKEAIKLFNIMQEEIGFNGYIGQNEEGQKFMVIQAPEGAIKAVPLRIEGLKVQMDNWTKKEGLYRMETQMYMDLCWFGDTNYSTPPQNMSESDKKYLQTINDRILKFHYYPMV
ncbi:hypothetical protein [Limosilactobacillus ingluviei]|uniref:hypothetical protein n=1 Tax=Limosilactobacillus ingluviei TaxID=148604 RepID=UPI0023F0718B|nr:hypothetical protein [Limosilactobacillus ingluviei]